MPAVRTKPCCRDRPIGTNEMTVPRPRVERTTVVQIVFVITRKQNAHVQDINRSNWTRRGVPGVLVMVVVLAAAGALPVRAQAPPESPATAQAVELSRPMGLSEPDPGDSHPALHRSLFEILKDGGVMMCLLFACSFITLVFVFERAISLAAAA